MCHARSRTGDRLHQPRRFQPGQRLVRIGRRSVHDGCQCLFAVQQPQARANRTFAKTVRPPTAPVSSAVRYRVRRLRPAVGKERDNDGGFNTVIRQQVGAVQRQIAAPVTSDNRNISHSVGLPYCCRDRSRDGCGRCRSHRQWSHPTW